MKPLDLFLQNLETFRAIDALCAKHQHDWEHQPAFVSCYEAFSSGLSELEQAYYLHDVLMLGVTPARDRLLREAIDRADVIAEALKAYSTFTGNAELARKVGFSKSSYLQRGNRHLMYLIGSIVDAAAEHAAQLNGNAFWRQHIEELERLKGQLAESIREEHGIVNLLANVEVLSERLDALVEAIGEDVPVLWKQYREIRIGAR